MAKHSCRIFQIAFSIILICFTFNSVSAIPITPVDNVVLDDAQVRIVSSNVTHGSNYIYTEITYKQIPTNPALVDVGFGINTSEMTLKDGEYYNPHYDNYTTEHDYVFYNVTILANMTLNKTAENISYGDYNNTYQYLIEHDVETENTTENGTVETIIVRNQSIVSCDSYKLHDGFSIVQVWWHTEEYGLIEWSDIPTNRITHVDYNYDNKNRWYLLRNFSATRNVTYRVRASFDFVHAMGDRQYKYDVVTKLSADTIPVAIANNRFKFIDPYGDTSNFNSTWNTSNISAGSSNSTAISLPLQATGTYNFTVWWGDGSSDYITTYNQANVTHNYESAGVKNLVIDGTITGFRFNNVGDRLKIQNISNWGSLRVGNSNGYFYGCANLDSTATDVLDLTGTTTMDGMFYGASAFNSNISAWNTSKVTSMANMFQSATSFNGNISAWNTSKVTTMTSMFYSASAFNQNISSWDTSKVTTMGGMFSYASSFNQNISAWNTSAVQYMDSMFSVASSFNGNISAWDTSKVTTMTSMFYYATSFNDNISAWNTAAVTTMAYMFYFAPSFNGNISSWNTSKVTSMEHMFGYASSFNQNLSAWNVSAVTTMQNMFSSVTLPTRYYTYMLLNWANQSVLNSVPFVGGNSKYNPVAVDARLHLTGTHLWTITDGGLVNPILPPTPASCAYSSKGTTWINISCTAGSGNITNWMDLYNLNTSQASTENTGFYWNNTGLTAGTAYTYTVYATNETVNNGTGLNTTSYTVIISTDSDASESIPPSPINLANTTGNFWINHTWQAGTGNVTNSYNVSQNGTWNNTSSLTYKNVSVGAHNWSNISVYAYNSSGTGSLNSTAISMNTQVPNNVISISNVSSSYSITEGQVLYINADYADADGDIGTFADNATQWDVNSGTGIVSWQTVDGDQGVYYWQINVTDGYGSVSTSAFLVTVGDSTPSVISSLGNTTGSFWINWTWNAGTNDDDYDVWVNNSDLGTDTTSLFYNGTYSAHASRTISVRGHNHTLNTYSGWVNQTTNISNNPITITNTSNKTVNETEIVYVDYEYTDLDSDTGVFSCNRTDLFTDFSTSSGTGNWTTNSSSAGTYYVDFGIIDGYGSSSNFTMQIVVNESTVPTEFSIQFIYPTPDNGSVNRTGSISINTSVSNGSNYTTLLKLDDSLVAWWRFDETSGGTIIQDYSGNGYNGTWHGNLTSNITIGRWGNGLLFDGLDDYVSIPCLNLGSVHSVSMWIDFKDVGDGVVFGRTGGSTYYNGYILYIDQTNLYYNSGGNGGSDYVTVSHGGLSSGVLNNIIVIRDNQTVRFFKNGVQLGTDQILATNTRLNGLISLGAYGIGSFYTNMILDDVRVYDRIISSDEINSSYNATENSLRYNTSNLSFGDRHTFTAYIQNNIGVLNQSETRYIDTLHMPISLTKPILILDSVNTTNNQNNYAEYFGEILKVEGYNQYQIEDIQDINSSNINNSKLIILPNISVSSEQETVLRNYVSSGGLLIADRPSISLADLFGLTFLESNVSNQYLKIDTTTPVGLGITNATMRFYNTADYYSINTGTTTAWLYSGYATNSTRPAVHSALNGSGQAILFTFCLVDNLISFMQGNRSQASNVVHDIDGDGVYRAGDLFYNHVNSSLTTIPQANEQMHLVSNSISYLLSSKQPIIRTWYFPNETRSLNLVIGDGESSPYSEIDVHQSDIQTYGHGNASYYVLDFFWNLTTVTNIRNSGDEVSDHMWFNGTPSLLDFNTEYSSETNQFKNIYGYFPYTSRHHWNVLVGWSDTAKIEEDNAVQMDLNYIGLTNNTGYRYITGSGLPIRFVDPTNKLIDVLNQPVLFEDDVVTGGSYENLGHAQALALSKNTLNDSIDKYHTVITHVFHPAYWSSYKTNWGIPYLNYSSERGIYFYTAQAWNNYTRARENSIIVDDWNEATRTYTIIINGTQPNDVPHNFTYLIPYEYSNNSIISFSMDGSPYPYQQTNIDDQTYGIFNTTLANHSFVISYELPEYIPPVPISLANTTGNFWVNHTWQAGSGNITNSYNVSQNGTWTNGSATLFKNVSVGAHNWSNISVYAYNSSGTGSLNSTPISMNTQVQNNAISITNTSNKTVNETETVYVDYDYTDLDSDSGIFSCNRTDLFTDFSTSSGAGNWTTNSSSAGTYYIDFGVIDGYGSSSNFTMQIIVNDILSESCTDIGSDGVENGVILVGTVLDNSTNCRTDGINDHIQLNYALYNISLDGGGTVHINDGIYILNGTSTIPSNTILEGAGRFNTRLILMNDAASLENIIESVSTTNISIRNITINGNRGPTRGGTGTLNQSNFVPDDNKGTPIYLEDVTNSVISNVTTTNAMCDDIVLMSSSSITIKDTSAIDAHHDGIVSYYSDYINLQRVYSSGFNLGVRISGTEDSIIQDGIFDGYSNIGDPGYGGAAIYVGYDGADATTNFTIQNNTIFNSSSGLNIYGVSPTAWSSQFVIKNNRILLLNDYNGEFEAIGINIHDHRNAVIESNTIAFGKNGIYASTAVQNLTIRNNIIYNMSTTCLYGTGLVNSYNNLYQCGTNYSGGASMGTGEIYTDPFFANSSISFGEFLFPDIPSYRGVYNITFPDLHLKSQYGRWNDTGWEYDIITSPAIDAGDPTSNYSNEPSPNGSRINIGAYGNTLFASKSSYEILIPPVPINITNTTGNFWVNHTWQAGAGNVTNSYNVSQNGTWNNTSSLLFKNVSVGAHNWSNISVYAYNSSGTGSLNSTPISMNTQVPNNPITITNTSNKTVSETETVYVDYDYTDIDSDMGVFSCNRTDLFTDFSTLVGTGNWTTNSSSAGTYYIDFGVIDGYGSSSNYTMQIIVNESTPPSGFANVSVYANKWQPILVNSSMPMAQYGSHTGAFAVSAWNVSTLRWDTHIVGRQSKASWPLIKGQGVETWFLTNKTVNMSLSTSYSWNLTPGWNLVGIE